MPRHVVALGVVLALIGVPVMAGAARLQQVDQQISKDTGPALAVQAGVCTGETEVTASAAVDPEQASMTSQSLATVSSDDPACTRVQTTVLNFILLFEIVGDAAEAPGTPVSLCLRETHSLIGGQKGGGVATTAFGGVPVEDPFTVIRLPANELLYQAGPLLIIGARERASANEALTANVGDFIQVSLGTTTSAEVTGIGAAGATVGTDLSIGIGSCVPSPVPVLSHGALAGLGLIPAGLGAVFVRRRRSITP